MKIFNGNCSVQGGYYLSIGSLSIEAISAGGGTLPGPRCVEYVAVPFPALYLLAPAIGLAFLTSIPALGFAYLARAWFSHRSLGRAATAAATHPAG